MRSWFSSSVNWHKGATVWIEIVSTWVKNVCTLSAHMSLLPDIQRGARLKENDGFWWVPSKNTSTEIWSKNLPEPDVYKLIFKKERPDSRWNLSTTRPHPNRPEDNHCKQREHKHQQDHDLSNSMTSSLYWWNSALQSILASFSFVLVLRPHCSHSVVFGCSSKTVSREIT